MNVVDQGLVPSEHLDLAGLAVACAAVTRLWQYRARTVHIRSQVGTPARIGEFGFAFFERAYCGFVPCRQIIEEADALEGELEFDRQADIDWQYYGLLVSFLRPIEFLAPAIRMGRVVDNRIPVDGSSAGLGQFDQELMTEFLQRPAHGPFDSAAIELPHHLRHFEEFLARRNVCRQVPAIIVAIGHTPGRGEAEAAC